MLEPRINVYTCEKCGGYTTTVDVDEGVTPFFLRCRTTPGCDGFGHSSFYPRDLKPKHIPKPTFEWYKPSGKKYKRLDAESKEHVDRGGLLIRPRTKAQPVYHAEEAH